MCYWLPREQKEPGQSLRDGPSQSRHWVEQPPSARRLTARAEVVKEEEEEEEEEEVDSSFGWNLISLS